MIAQRKGGFVEQEGVWDNEPNSAFVGLDKLHGKFKKGPCRFIIPRLRKRPRKSSTLNAAQFDSPRRVAKDGIKSSITGGFEEEFGEFQFPMEEPVFFTQRTGLLFNFDVMSRDLVRYAALVEVIVERSLADFND